MMFRPLHDRVLIRRIDAEMTIHQGALTIVENRRDAEEARRSANARSSMEY
jgi:co-chaperonin GroES (HSP10)